MPVDQQPCTTAFCEVHDFSENNNVEEVHIIKDAATYSIVVESTYQRADLGDLDHIMDDEERPWSILKLYLSDSRPLNQSLLNNGVVDISLIDAPGLNRDSVKTTALFARQEEIDVVVFVVSVENHLTESARNFLKTASNEKACFLPSISCPPSELIAYLRSLNLSQTASQLWIAEGRGR
jgi:mitofusin